jgi:hypothetical protein
MKWVKALRDVSANNTTATLYRLEGTEYTVLSLKRPIPHANGVGAWMHTTFTVQRDGQQIAEKYTLKAAKAYAEEQYKKEAGT